MPGPRRPSAPSLLAPAPLSSSVRSLRLAPKAPPTPEELVAGIVAKDAGAAALAWRTYAPMTYRLLRRLLGPDHELDDLAQEVFLRVFAQAGTLRDARALPSFIQGVAVRVARKDLRKRWVRRWLRLSPSGDLPDAPSARDDAASEALRRFYALLDTLDATSRTLFVLRHVEDQELLDVSLLVGLSVATVKRRLARVEATLSALVARDPVLAAYAGGDAPWLLRKAAE